MAIAGYLQIGLLCLKANRFVLEIQGLYTREQISGVRERKRSQRFDLI